MPALGRQQVEEVRQRQDGRPDEIGDNAFQAMLGHEAFKQAVGCTNDVACMAEIAGAAGVSLLLTGTQLDASSARGLQARSV